MSRTAPIGGSLLKEETSDLPRSFTSRSHPALILPTMATKPHRSKILLATGCTALLVLLSGCASTEIDETNDSSAPPTSVERPDDESTGEAVPAESPLEELLGFRVSHRPEGLDTAVPALNPDSAGPSEQDRRDQLRLEEMIAACMRSEGFEYVVRDPFGGTVGSLKDSPYALPPDEFAAQYGYGISTIDVPSATEVDPNSAALAAMNPAEREAYLWALDGGVEQGDTQNTGCRGRAVEEVFGRSTAGTSDPSDPTAEFAPLVAEIRTLDERIDSDPRVAVDANRRWADCMADAGHPGLTRPSDSSNSVRTRLAQATARRGDPSAIADVRAYEVAVARADSICREDYDAARRQVRDELEHRFIADHRPELERYRDAMNAGGER